MKRVRFAILQDNGHLRAISGAHQDDVYACLSAIQDNYDNEIETVKEWFPIETMHYPYISNRLGSTYMMLYTEWKPVYDSENKVIAVLLR